jgi:hypothetical protein
MSKLAKYALLILLIAMLASCVTQKRHRKPAPCPCLKEGKRK